jgi:hypothetical protein
VFDIQGLPDQRAIADLKGSGQKNLLHAIFKAPPCAGPGNAGAPFPGLTNSLQAAG